MKFRPPTIEKYIITHKFLQQQYLCSILFYVTWCKDIDLCGMYFQSVEYFKTVEKSQIPY